MKQKITGKEKLLETLEWLMEKFPHLRAQLETTWRRLKEQKNGASNG